MAFSPTIEEIFKYFLKPLIEGQKDDYLSIIYKTGELYGENVDIEHTFERGLSNHRKHVSEHGDDDYVWFFTKLKRLDTSKLGHDRKAGDRTWTAKTAATPVYEDKQEFWRGKHSTFFLNGPQDVNNSANWIMHEFWMEKDGKQYSDYVIVKIKRQKVTPSCEVLRATRRKTDVPSCSHVTYQYHKPLPRYHHVTAAAAAPPPTQDAQQGEYKLDLCTGPLAAEQAEGSNDNIRLKDQEGSEEDNFTQEEIDLLTEELKGSPIGADNTAAQDHNQENGTTDPDSGTATGAQREIIFSKFSCLRFAKY